MKNQLNRLLIVPLGLAIASTLSAADTRVALAGHVLPQLQTASMMGHTAASEPVQLSVVMHLDQTLLDATYNQLYGPNASDNKHFLSSTEFARIFNVAEKRNALKTFAEANGLTVEAGEDRGESMVVNVSGPAHLVEQAFAVQLNHYQAKDGRQFRANSTNPKIPEALAPQVGAILGLSNLGERAHPHLLPVPKPLAAARASQASAGVGPASFIGSQGAYLTPSDIQSVYGLNALALNGSGQSVALLELDGFNPADITSFETEFNLPAVSPTFVSVDGAPNLCGKNQNLACNSTTVLSDFGGMGEVALDIEMVISLAPSISKIYVYTGHNTDQGIIDIYNKMATDNVSKVVSTSWGLDEGDANPTGSSFVSTESQIFQRMAIQGQSVFAASGDCGAYDTRDFNTGACIKTQGFHVDDPASQPYVTGVGGTTLTGTLGTFSETTWNELALSDGGSSGGGISAIWPIPSYQVGVPGLASQLVRNVPDVSLNADWTASPYAMWVGGSGYLNGGTSAAAPLWAALTALINQERSSVGKTQIGFMNPTLYQLGTSTSSTIVFGDVTSGNNVLYSAGTGYDNATGWGSFKGAGIITQASAVNSLVFTNCSNVYAYPNPWDARKGHARFVTIANVLDNTTVKIFTLSGFWVKTLHASTGSNAVVWDLTNDDGKRVASGLYFYIVSSGVCSTKGTIAIIK